LVLVALALAEPVQTPLGVLTPKGVCTGSAKAEATFIKKISMPQRYCMNYTNPYFQFKKEQAGFIIFIKTPNTIFIYIFVQNLTE
jgi:hypothetical protein